MKNAPAIHLAIIQPAGYVHSLGFLDQARYFRHMFRRQGATRDDGQEPAARGRGELRVRRAPGLPADWQERHACVFVNLEQLGQGGAAVSPDYLALLRRSAVVDYDAANVGRLRAGSGRRAHRLVRLRRLPGQARAAAGGAPDRPAVLRQHQPAPPASSSPAWRPPASTWPRSTRPVYGPERDEFIRQAKAVLNCHYYESNRFEQARAFHCLSLGTPVISEYTPTTDPAPAFRDSVLWLPEQVEEWFRLHFDTPAFYEEARKRLAAFRTRRRRARPDRRSSPTCWPSPAASSRASRACARRARGARARSTSARARTTSRPGSTSTSSTAPSPTSCSTWASR